MSDDQNSKEVEKDSQAAEKKLDTQNEAMDISVPMEHVYVKMLQQLSKMGGEPLSTVCAKLIKVALLDIQARAQASTQQLPKKGPIITKVGDLGQIRTTPRSKKIIH